MWILKLKLIIEMDNIMIKTDLQCFEDLANTLMYYMFHGQQEGRFNFNTLF